MAIGIRVLSDNLSGQTVNVTFNPYSGGTIDVGTQTIPFNYLNSYYFGDYDVYVPLYDYTYEFSTNLPGFDNCVNFLTPGSIYVFSSNTVTPLSTFLGGPILGNGVDIANTTTKLWTYTGYLDPAPIYEYNITLNPFTISYNRTITANGVELGAGLCAISNTSLLSTSGSTLIEIDITSSTAVVTPKFNITGLIAGDIILTTNNLVYTTTTDGFLRCYDYTTGSLVFAYSLLPSIPSPLGLFIYDSELYIANANGDIWLFSPASPYGITYVKNTGTFIGGASSAPDCQIVNIVTPTPTVTTTPTVTPTPSLTPSNTPTVTVTPTNTSTPTNTPSSTPTNTPSVSQSPQSTSTPTPTPTPTNTSTPTNTPSSTPTNTPSQTTTSTPTNTPSSTPTNTPTNTVTPTSTTTPTPTPTTPTCYSWSYSFVGTPGYDCGESILYTDCAGNSASIAPPSPANVWSNGATGTFCSQTTPTQVCTGWTFTNIGLCTTTPTPTATNTSTPTPTSTISFYEFTNVGFDASSFSNSCSDTSQTIYSNKPWNSLTNFDILYTDSSLTTPVGAGLWSYTSGSRTYYQTNSSGIITAGPSLCI